MGEEGSREQPSSEKTCICDSSLRRSRFPRRSPRQHQPEPEPAPRRRRDPGRGRAALIVETWGSINATVMEVRTLLSEEERIRGRAPARHGRGTDRKPLESAAFPSSGPSAAGLDVHDPSPCRGTELTIGQRDPECPTCGARDHHCPSDLTEPPSVSRAASRWVAFHRRRARSLQSPARQTHPTRVERAQPPSAGIPSEIVTVGEHPPASCEIQRLIRRHSLGKSSFLVWC